MSDVLKKYSIVIGADTRELMTELHKAEQELIKKLDNKDLGAGVRSSIEKLVEEIKTMRSELKATTKDINNSITAISTDSLKNEFGGLQKIISNDIQVLQTKIEGLQGTIDNLNEKGGLKNLEGSLTGTFANIEAKMNNIMEEFKIFHQFTQDLRVGAINTSVLDNSIKKSANTLKKETEAMKEDLRGLLGSYTDATSKNIVINGIGEDNITEAEEYLSVIRNIISLMSKMDAQSVTSVINAEEIFVDEASLKQQAKRLHNYISDFYNDIREGVQGKAPDIYLRWKTEINPDETAEDIIKKIDDKYTNKVQEHLDKKPLKFKSELDEKDLESVVKKAIKQENELLKAENAPKIKVGLEIDGLDKSKLDKVSSDLSEKVNETQAGALNVNGGNLNLSSDNLAQESTLSEIKDILSTWNGSGVPGTQSKEQIKQNHQTASNLKNAGYLLRGKFRGSISKDEINATELREQILSEQEWLYARMEEMKKLRRIGMKRMINNPDLLKNSELYNASVNIDGVDYAKWGNGTTTLTDWQAQLDKVLEEGINDYFKDAVKSIEKQLKAKTENLNLLGVEFDKDGKILNRESVAIGQNETYKAAYGKVSSLRNQVLNGTVDETGVIKNSLQEENNKLQLLKQQRTLMQQIVELSTKQSSVDLSKEEEEKLNSLKEQLRIITQVCSDEIKFNTLLKEEAELQDKMNSGKLDSKGFNRLMSIRREMSTMWTDASDDMVEFSRQALSSTDTQLSQIDNDITQQQAKINKLISNFRSGFAQIQRETFGNDIKNDDDYERKLKQWKSDSQELAVLQNSITKVDSNGKITYDMSALLESEKERYWHLNNSVSKLGEQLNLYRKLKNIHAEVIGEEIKENEILAVKNKNLSETDKIISSIYSRGGVDLTEQENLSLMSVEELQDLSNKLGNVVDSASVNVDEKLEQKAYQYIDQRIKFLEKQLSHANDRIKELTEKGGSTSYWEGQKTKIQTDISSLKATQNQAKTEQEIIESIRIQNKLDDESLVKIREILDLTVQIEQSNARISKLSNIIDQDSNGRDLEISKRKANQERIKENDNLKKLELQRKQVFDTLSFNDNKDDITYTLSNLLQNGLNGVSDELITDFINKRLARAFVDSTVSNVKSTEATVRSDVEKAASTKERVDAVIKERLIQQKITEEKRKQSELDASKNKDVNFEDEILKNKALEKQYSEEILKLEKKIDSIRRKDSLSKKKTNAYNSFLDKNKKISSLLEGSEKSEYNSTISKISALEDLVNNLKSNNNRTSNIFSIRRGNSKIKFSQLSEEQQAEYIAKKEKEIVALKEKLPSLQQKHNRLLDETAKKVDKILQSQEKIFLTQRDDVAAQQTLDFSQQIQKDYYKKLKEYKNSFNNFGASEDTIELGDEVITLRNKYLESVMTYLSYGGDKNNVNKLFYSAMEDTKDVLSSNKVIENENIALKENLEHKLSITKSTLDYLANLKEELLLKEQSIENEKEYINLLEKQYSIANTKKNARTEQSDLFAYSSKNSISKGMSNEQKMASFKVDYQLDSITKLLDKQEKIRISTGETSSEYLEVSKQIDVAKSRLESFRNEAVELGLTISQTTGRAFLDSSKESVALYKNMWTGVSEPYARTKEQLDAVRVENKAIREENERTLQEQKELDDKVTEAKLGTAKAEGTVVSETKKATNESKHYLGMTEGEAELTKKLFDENGKLLQMYRKKNDYTQEDINQQKEVVEQLKRQVEQSERLELYNSKRNTTNARLKSQYSSTNNSMSSHASSTPDLPATEKTLVEIKNILNNKFGVKSTSKTSEKQSSKKDNGTFNTKGYQEVAKSLGLLQKAKNGNLYVKKKDREKVYSEMDKLGVARFIDEDTKATKENVKAKKESKKAVDGDTSATKKNTSEKSNKTKETTSSYDADLYKKIARDNNWLNKNGSVQKDKRSHVYLEMEKQKPGSSGKTKEQLEELRKKINETNVAQKELNKEKQKDTSDVIKKETKEVKQKNESIQETLNKTQALKYLMEKGLNKKDANDAFELGKFTLGDNGKYNIYKSELDDLIYYINTAKELINETNISSGNNTFNDRLYGFDNENLKSLDDYILRYRELLKLEKEVESKSSTPKIKATPTDDGKGLRPVAGSDYNFDELFILRELAELEKTVYSQYNQDLKLLALQKGNVTNATKSQANAEKELQSISSTSAKDTFKGDAFTVAVKYSKDTLQKFIEGAKAETPEMEKTFAELAKIPEEMIRTALEINSPSEIMKKLGFWTIEGYVVGVTENADKVREALENAIKNGIVSKDELDELANYTKHRQKNVSNKNIYQGIQNLDLESFSLDEIQKQKELISSVLPLLSIFDVDNKTMSQKNAATFIRENTVEVQNAIQEYINIYKNIGEIKTVDDFFEDIFGDKHKTVSNAYSSAIEKTAQDVKESVDDIIDSTDKLSQKDINKTFSSYEKALKSYGTVSLNIENGNITNKNLQDRESLTREILSLEKQINEYESQGINVDDIRNKAAEIRQKNEKNILTTKLKFFSLSLSELQNSSNGNQLFIQQVSQLSQKISQLHEFASRPFLSEEEGKYAKDLTKNIQDTISRLSSLGNIELTSFINPESVVQALNSMTGIEKGSVSILNNGTKIVGTIKEANGVSRKLEYTWDNVLGCFTQSTKELTNHISLWTSISNGVKKSWNYLKSYFSGYMIAQRVFSTIRTGVTYIKELDSALTEMKKVSDESTESLLKFQKQSFDVAKSIGSTSVEIQNSAADFMRLGYSLNEASQLAKDANIYANVGDMEIDEATEHMVSSIQAWQSEFSSVTETSTALIDKYNEIGNNYAITSADIGSAMERSAAALKSAGNTVDETIGLITAGNLIQQDADTTANALKVMSLRIRGSKAELEEMGESTDDLAESSSKLREQLKSLTGVDIMSDDNTYKSTAAIIQEIGAVWDNLTDVSQAATLETLAGKTRASTVSGLIENYKVIAEVAKDAEEAQGSAMKENIEYMDSIEGRTAKLTTQVQEFWYELIDSETVKITITSLAELLRILTDIVDKAGLLGTIGLGAGLFAGFKNVGIDMLVAC